MVTALHDYHIHFVLNQSSRATKGEPREKIIKHFFVLSSAECEIYTAEM